MGLRLRREKALRDQSGCWLIGGAKLQEGMKAGAISAVSRTEVAKPLASNNAAQCFADSVVPRRRTHIQFRLIYSGELPSSQKGRRKETHAIRRQLHTQLAQLWSVVPFLARRKSDVVSAVTKRRDGPTVKTTHLQEIAGKFTRCGFSFVPLITEDEGLACAIDILFLRPEAPGSIITKGGGDIDNRIKTLFDALRIPQECSEVEGLSPSPNEHPFFCLLEDDALITEVKVTTDRLLSGSKNVHDVHLVMTINTQIVDPEKAYIEFMA